MGISGNLPASLNGLLTPETVRPKPAGAVTVPAAPAADQLSIRFAGKVEQKTANHIEDIQKRGVLIPGGGGTMGADIALTHLNGNIPVTLLDMNPAAVDRGEGKIQAGLSDAVKKGIMTPEEGDKRSKMILSKETDPATVPNQPGPAFAIEAIFENFDLKANLFKTLNARLPEDTILATNTSSLDVEKLAEASGRPDRFIGIHFFLPAFKNKLVEIIPSSKTSEETIEKTKALVKALGKTPIVTKNSPGFVVNRMLVPAMNEGIKIWEELVNDSIDSYKKIHGADPSPAVVEGIEKKMATTVEAAAKELMWPTVSKNPKAAAILVGPFSGLNMPEYMGLAPEILKILHEGLGEAYKPADIVLKKAEAFNALRKENPPDFKDRFAALQYKLGGPELVDPDIKTLVRDRLSGLLIGIAMQLLEDGVMQPEDLNRGMGVGTRWELAPFELVNKLGAEKSLSLVEAYAKTNPAFHVPDNLKTLAAEKGRVSLNYVDTRLEGSTQYITINKPQRNNALDQAMLTNIRKALKAAEKNPAVKTIVFESVGGSNFISGADLPALQEQMKKMRPDQQLITFRNLIMQGFDLMNDIANSPKVTVAKVNGNALGGGTEVALACDYIVASEKASFGLPEVQYGIYPAWGGTERLPERVGPSLARFMILEGGLTKSGEGPGVLNAQEAKAVGLADKVATHNELDEVVREGIESGEFAKKRERQSNKQAEKAAVARVNGQARFADKLLRYQSASLDDLVANELATLSPPSQQKLFKPVLELAERRIRKANSHVPDALRLRNDIDAMLTNYQAVQGVKSAPWMKAAQKALIWTVPNRGN